MPKRDYFHDPDAPRANSIVVAASAFVQDDAGRALMIQRSDNDLWAIPGGAQDLGESIVETAVREVREETGLTIDVVGLIGIYSDPGHVIAYDDGEVRQEFSVCFRGVPTAGTLSPSDESKRVEWVDQHELARLDVHPSIRLRIGHGLRHSDRPYLGDR